MENRTAQNGIRFRNAVGKSSREAVSPLNTGYFTETTGYSDFSGAVYGGNREFCLTWTGVFANN